MRVALLILFLPFFNPDVYGQSVSPETAYPFDRLLTTSAIRSYQIIIGPSKGFYCPMSPSCSVYGMEAFSTQNPLKAYLVTADRLHRCGHDLTYYSTINSTESVRFIDSVSYKEEPVEQTRVTIIRPFRYLLPINSHPDTISESDKLFQFALNLAYEERFQLAAIEFNRYRQYYPFSPFTENAILGYHYCEFRAGNFLLLTTSLTSKSTYSERTNDLVVLLKASAFYKLGNFQAVVREIEQHTFHNPDLEDAGNMLAGTALAWLKDWDGSIGYFSKTTTDIYQAKAKKFTELSTKAKSIDPKSGSTAGLLSVLPGAGYWYAGYPQTAVSSLIVNGLFFAATAQAFKSDQPVLGGILGFISAGWYAGNIYGSAVSAERRNEWEINQILSEMELSFH